MNFAGAILEAAPDAILVVEADGVIVVANRAAEALFGHEPLTGMAISDVIPGESTGRRADGSEFPAEIHRSVLGPHEIAIVRDVTERRRLESERVRSLQEVSDVALRGLEPDALLEAVLEPVGAALDAPLVAISLRDAEHGVIRVRAVRGLPDAARGHVVRHGEGVAGRIIAGGAHSYGEARMLVAEQWRAEVTDAMIGVPLVLGSERIGALVVGRDSGFEEDDIALLGRFGERIARAIDQGEAREAAVAAETRLREILDDVAGIVWEADDLARRRYTFVSSGAETLLGYPLSDWLERDRLWSGRIDSADRDDVLSRSAEAIAAGSDHELEYRIVTADGRTIWLRDRVRVTPGEPLRGLMIDVTERRELETNLLQAQKMQAVGQLAGGVAHDFNNMLTAILGYSGLLSARLRDPDSREDLAEIERAAKRAQGLTEQLLAFSRRQVPRSELFDLGELVAGMQPMLGRLIDEDIALIVEPGGRTVLLEGDPGRLEQVLVNLVINARDAMPGGGRLTVSVGVHEGAAELRVTDTGNGMDAATKARVFEPFFTTKAPGKGTGLGLATVYGIVSQAGGRIAIESGVGVGTEVSVRLPMSVSATAEEPAEARPTVLIVEDELALRKLVRRVLEDDGKRVLDAGNGHEALGVLEREGDHVDLMITDIVMPGMNGPELVAKVGERWPRLRVIYSSGYTDSRLAGRGFDEGKVDLLRKPYTLEELRARVADALEG